MNRNKALLAIAEGKKVNVKGWAKNKYLCTYQGYIVDEDRDYVDFNKYWDGDGWEIYEEPKPKRKFYRRKWIMYDKNSLYTEIAWELSKQEFDNQHSMAIEKSEEWEECEV